VGTKSGNSSGGETASPEQHKSTLTSGGKLIFPLTEAENDLIGSIVAKSEIVVAESHATGALICEATGKPVAVAKDLLPAGKTLRQKYPKAKLIFCADHDAWTKVNPGESEARDAARVLRAKVAFPTPSGIRVIGKAFDFNDLYRAEGPKAVRASIDRAIFQDPLRTELPCGFRASDDGSIEYWNEDAADWRPLCSYFDVAAVTRDEDGKDWGRLIQVRDRDGVLHTWAMPMAMTSGSGEIYRARLLSMGLDIAPGAEARNKLHELITRCRPHRLVRCVDKFGWCGSHFVLPFATIGADEDGAEDVVFQREAPIDHNFRQRGTLQAWQDEVAAPVAGNSRLVFAISLALAAPLLEPLNIEGGGVHFYGASSCGKTTCAHVAGSVWGGGGADGYLQRWRTTDNGLEGVLAVHNGSLLILDDSTQASPKVFSEAIYLIANGHGKSRATCRGGPRKVSEWRVMAMSTGELSSADTIRRGGKVLGGHMVRMGDIPADAKAGLGIFEKLPADISAMPLGENDKCATFAHKLKTVAHANYGHAAVAFLEGLVADLSGNLAAAEALIEGFIEQESAGLSEQLKRLAKRFAVAAAAGELAIKMNILPWKEGEARNAAVTCFKDCRDALGHSGANAHEIEEGIQQVRAVIERDGSSRFQPWSEPERRITHRLGFVKGSNHETRTFYFLPEGWKTACQGYDAGAIAKELVARGILEAGSDGKTSKLVKLPGLGPRRCYVIRADAFAESDEI